MGRYFRVEAGSEVWKRLSPGLRGKEFTVALRWWDGCALKFSDWKLLVEAGAAGKTVYVQKFKRVDYREVIKNAKWQIPYNRRLHRA